MVLVHDPAPLAEILAICPPERITQQFGIEVAVWAWVNRVSRLPTKTRSRSATAANNHFDPLKKYLFSKDFDVALIDTITAQLSARTGSVKVQSVLKIYEMTRRQIANVSPEVPFKRQRKKTVDQRLFNCYKKYWSSNSKIRTRDKLAVTQLLEKRKDHLPASVSQADLEKIGAEGKNPQVLRFLIASIPPAYIAKEFGRDAKTILLWTAINFSGEHSEQHHVGGDDANFERIMVFLSKTYEIDDKHFKRAQLMTWALCQGSVDFEVVMANYKLQLCQDFIEHEYFPITDIMRRCAIGKFREQKSQKYGVSVLKTHPLAIEGADVVWAKREFKYSQGMTRQFKNTVRIDAPNGIAWTHGEPPKRRLKNKIWQFPILMAAYHVHRAFDGSLEILIRQIQGVRIELHQKNRKKWIPMPTPKALWVNGRSVAVEMVMEATKRMGLRVAVLGKKWSFYGDQVEKIRPYDERTKTIWLRGELPVKDQAGNFTWPNAPVPPPSFDWVEEW